MGPVRIEVQRPVFGAPALSRTSAGIACLLGVMRNDLAPAAPDPPTVSLDAAPGALTVLVGPSGCGKSTLLRVFTEGAQARGFQIITPPMGSLPDRPVCDLVANNPVDAMRTLAACGLADVRAMVRTPRELSEGQRARVRIALAVHKAERAARRGARVIMVIDEFASNLDGLTARALACLVHRIARREPRFACVVATSRTDVVEHLAPTAVVAFAPDGRAAVRAQRHARPPGVRLRIRAGTRAEYARLAPLHYRPGDPATMERILSAVDTDTGVLAGVLVVSRPVVFAAWRDLAWPGRYTRGKPRTLARRINREIRCISRVIVDPRFRAMGVARRVVTAYLRRPLTVCTEALAAMGHASPSGGFFAEAGMTVYRTPPRAADARVLDALDHIGVDRWRLADPGALRARLGSGSRSLLLEREVRRWAGATGRTRRWRDAPVEMVLAAAARSVGTTPIAYAHTKREACQKRAA